MHMLAVMVDPGLLVTLIPLGVIFLGVVTFEIAMAVTISTLPRSRMQQRWTVREQRRVIRVFAAIFSVWPIGVAVVMAHVFLPVLAAVAMDLVVVALVVMFMRWLRQGMREHRLVHAGHCENCFYDLRASLEREACPECGTELHDHPARPRPKPARSRSHGPAPLPDIASESHARR